MGKRWREDGEGGVGKRSVNPEDVVTRNGKRLAACPSDAQNWRRKVSPCGEEQQSSRHEVVPMLHMPLGKWLGEKQQGRNDRGFLMVWEACGRLAELMVAR